MIDMVVIDFATAMTPWWEEVLGVDRVSFMGVITPGRGTLPRISLHYQR